MTLIDKQKAALQAVADKPGAMAIVHFGKLRDAGYVEKADGLNINRGYAAAKITASGLAALRG